VSDLIAEIKVFFAYSVTSETMSGCQRLMLQPAPGTRIDRYRSRSRVLARSVIGWQSGGVDVVGEIDHRGLGIHPECGGYQLGVHGVDEAGIPAGDASTMKLASNPERFIDQAE
jgi:hypothetical protein